MSANKKYYWIKLKDSFMTSDAVDFLMGQPDGANYVVLYQMLCLKTVNTGGRLERQIGEVIIPYDEAKIQRDTKYFTIDTVRVALTLYKRLGLIYVDNNGALCLANYENMVGSESKWAIQKRNQREAKLLTWGGQCPPDVRENVHPDIRDKEKDNRDKDKEKESRERESIEKESEGADAPAPSKPKKVYHKYGEYGWVKLTDEEKAKLESEMGAAELERCIRYVDESAEGTKNKNGWRSWIAVLRKCHREQWGMKGPARGRVATYDYGDKDEFPF